MAGVKTEGSVARAEEGCRETYRSLSCGAFLIAYRPQEGLGPLSELQQGSIRCAFYKALPGCCVLGEGISGARKDTEKPIPRLCQETVVGEKLREVSLHPLSVSNVTKYLCD